MLLGLYLAFGCIPERRLRQESKRREPGAVLEMDWREEERPGPGQIECARRRRDQGRARKEGGKVIADLGRLTRRTSAFCLTLSWV